MENDVAELKFFKNFLAPFVAILLAVPFFVINAALNAQRGPMYSWLSDMPGVRDSMWLPVILLLLLPGGALIALLASRRPEHGLVPAGLYFGNLFIAIILLIIFVALAIPTVQEVYRSIVS